MLFTDDGAYLAIANGDGGPHSSPKTQRRQRTRTKQGGTVVLKAGFDPTHMGKRGLRPRLADANGAMANFFIGARADSPVHIPLYNQLVYDQVWDGVTVTYHSLADGLGLTVSVAPSADPAAIEIETGAALTLREDGVMIAQLGDGAVQFAKPDAYQILNGRRMPVAVRYRVLPGGRIGFDVGAVHPAATLTIEPQLSWSTYFGGGGSDRTENVQDVALDGAGNIYIAGFSAAADFPVTAGSFDETWNGSQDVFVAKLNPAGDQLLYKTESGGECINLRHFFRRRRSGIRP